MSKFKSEFYNDDAWKDAFKEDGDELLNGGQAEEDEDGEIADDVDPAMGLIIAEKLPAPLDLLIYVELWTWINRETIKEYWAKGGKKKCLKWGGSSF